MQWIDFLNGYWPVWEAQGGHPAVSGLTGGWINTTTNQPGVDPGYYIVEGAEQFAVKVTWRVAAAYTNWMHNGQVNEAWAFECGAYDTSTFGGNRGGWHGLGATGFSIEKPVQMRVQLLKCSQ